MSFVLLTREGVLYFLNNFMQLGGMIIFVTPPFITQIYLPGPPDPDFLHVNQKCIFLWEGGVQDPANLRSIFYLGKCKWSIMVSYGSVRVSKGQLG